jgi:hypothetical protein
MNDFLYTTKKLLEHKFPPGKVQASKVIDFLIGELELTIDCVDIARTILFELEREGYLYYISSLFGANYVVFFEQPVKQDTHL